MYTVLVISLIIVIVVLLLSLVTTTKAYDYKHTVDPLEENQHLGETDLGDIKEDEHQDK